jgi:hypothetical protein
MEEEEEEAAEEEEEEEPYVRPLRPEGVSRTASLLGCPLAFQRLPVPSTPDRPW